MNLYFQVFTQDQTADAIDLIRIPSHLSLGSKVRARAKVSAGAIRRVGLGQLDSLSTNLGEERFNKVEVIYDVTRVKLGALTVAIKYINGLFTLFPTSALWLPASECDVRDRSSNSRTLYAASLEHKASHFNLRSAPIAFELVIAIDTSYKEGRILDECAEWLADVMPREFDDLKTFGCCDLGGKEFRVQLLRSGMMLNDIREMMYVPPNRYEELGGKFRRLHPVMFGFSKPCLGIASALGKQGRVVGGRAGGEFATIRLKLGGDLTTSENVAKRWLLSG